MTVVFHPEASQDVQEAFRWYESRDSDVADAFRAALDRAVDRIRERPLGCPTYGHGLRRVLLKKFPFQVVFRPGETEVFVVAVAHFKRRPRFWLERL